MHNIYKNYILYVRIYIVQYSTIIMVSSTHYLRTYILYTYNNMFEDREGY